MEAHPATPRAAIRTATIPAVKNIFLVNLIFIFPHSVLCGLLIVP
ncbi:hypothetical protein ASZ90_010400 [hydrocarbon metagenome]|uniref:Uncharacterized protein n=1 Tax=hydrocarbon metagenome TaxID=938273 RepID=A0A0W8FG64_9ZZZZ